MKMKIVFLFLYSVLSTIIVVSCASGSAIVTGQTRPPIDAQSVKLYLEAPITYEIIGLVTASSDSGWTDQDSVNCAIEDLKKRAAKIGANGILLDKIDKTTSEYISSIGNTFYSIPVTEQTVSGKAIYVE